MSKYHFNRKRLVAIIVISTSVAIPCLLLYREIRHHRLNGELIRAIQARKDDWAISVLHQGADGTARESDTKPFSFREMMERVKARVVRHPSTPQVKGHNLSALTLYYELWPDAYTSFGHEPTYPSERVPLALLDTDCTIDDVDQHGRNSLCMASAMHQHAVVRLLVDRGANINLIPDPDLNTPLMAADAEDAAYLLDHGANINQGILNGTNALFVADGKKAEMLLKRGAKINVTNWNNETPLIFACMRRHEDSVLALLAHHPDLEARDVNSATALLYAVGTCRLETVKALIHAGANIRVLDTGRDTALVLSLDNFDDRVFDWALAQGIDVNRSSTAGDTALEVAKHLLPYRMRAGKPDPNLLRKIKMLESRGAKSGSEVIRQFNKGSMEPATR